MTPQTAENACPRCGGFDVPRYEGELPICGHCGAILATEPPEPPSWINQFPAPKRSALAQHFYTAVCSGATDPASIVAHVQASLHRRLQWTVDHDQRQWFSQVLNTLRDDPRAAEAYAAEVWEREQLPRAEREALKREKAKAFVLEAMRGKPVTDKQLYLLRARGYTGPRPADRARASTLIDALLLKKVTS